MLLDAKFCLINKMHCSVAGMLVMFTGLYFVLWAKGKEDYTNDEANDAFAIASEFEFDAEKPLILS